MHLKSAVFGRYVTYVTRLERLFDSHSVHRLQMIIIIIITTTVQRIKPFFGFNCD